MGIRDRDYTSSWAAPAGRFWRWLVLLLLLGLGVSFLLLSLPAGPARSQTCSLDRPGGIAARVVASTPVYTYTVRQVYPHDPDAFTQGLVYTNTYLYEGTGLYGRSSLRRVDLETGTVLKMYELPSDEYFGEGITVVGERIWQLTWQSRVAFVYDRDTFAPLDTFTYTTEGWGLTYDGERLIMSDGSDTLYFRDPETFSETGRVRVYDHRGPVRRLNELEYVDGQVYANVWLTDKVVRIDPHSGRVTAWIDLSGLLTPEEQAAADVLNGIAYDVEGERLFVTGKLWPKLFEIELVLEEPLVLGLPIVVQRRSGTM